MVPIRLSFLPLKRARSKASLFCGPRRYTGFAQSLNDHSFLSLDMDSIEIPEISMDLADRQANAGAVFHVSDLAYFKFTYCEGL